MLHGEHGLTRVIPVDADGYFYIDWSMGLNDPNLAAGPFEDLLQGAGRTRRRHPVTNQWKDKLVVIGSTATGNDLTDTGRHGFGERHLSWSANIGTWPIP